MKRLLIIASALAALPSVSSASPGVDIESRSFTVRYDDLDLSTASGRATLEKRLAFAVRKVCFEAGPPSPQRLRATKECANAAGRQALADAKTAIAAANAGPATELASTEPLWH